MVVPSTAAGETNLPPVAAWLVCATCSGRRYFGLSRSRKPQSITGGTLRCTAMSIAQGANGLLSVFTKDVKTMRNHLSASRWCGLVLSGTLLIGMLAIVTPASAKHHDEGPPGWSHGEKRGWNGRNEPPGQYRKHSHRRHHRSDFDNDRDDRGSYSEYNYRHDQRVGSNNEYSRPDVSVFTRNRTYSSQQPEITVRQSPGRTRIGRRVQAPRISIHRR